MVAAGNKVSGGIVGSSLTIRQRGVGSEVGEIDRDLECRAENLEFNYSEASGQEHHKF